MVSVLSRWLMEYSLLCVVSRTFGVNSFSACIRIPEMLFSGSRNTGFWIRKCQLTSLLCYDRFISSFFKIRTIFSSGNDVFRIRKYTNLDTERPADTLAALWQIYLYFLFKIRTIFLPWFSEYNSRYGNANILAALWHIFSFFKTRAIFSSLAFPLPFSCHACCRSCSHCGDVL